MTFEQVIAFLKRYPGEHPSPIRLGRVQGSSNVFKVIPAETYVASLLDLLGVTLNTQGTLVKLLPNSDDDTIKAFQDISPHLLRAWLGPVPVVLPEGCSVDPVSKVRQWQDRGQVFLMEAGAAGLRIATVEDSAIIPDATLHWLRTGEVTP